MPVLEEICIVYPGWCTKKKQRVLSTQAQAASNEASSQRTPAENMTEAEATNRVTQDSPQIDGQGAVENVKGDYEETDSNDDSAEQDKNGLNMDGSMPVVINGQIMVECYHTKRQKIIEKFPNVLKIYSFPNRHHFDSLPAFL